MIRHWSVNVSLNGESLVTIESNCLSGKPEFTEEEATVIRTAAIHLTSFIGKPEPKAHAFIASYGNSSYCQTCGELRVTHSAASLCPGYRRSDYGKEATCKYCDLKESEHL